MTGYVPCEGSNQPPMTVNDCQVCGRTFELSLSGYVPRHSAPRPPQPCTKTRYATRAAARMALVDIWADVQQALEHLRRTGKVPRRTYRCSCGGWHLTSQERTA